MTSENACQKPTGNSRKPNRVRERSVCDRWTDRNAIDDTVRAVQHCRA